MDCRMIQGELLAYTLALPIDVTSRGSSTSDEDRARIDEHLVACTTCLRAYLRLKRHVERGASLAERPNDEVRRRIRADVAAVVRPRGAARVRHWLRRPIPLYQGLAVAAVAAGVAVGLPQLVSAFAHKSPETTAQVDMSKPVPDALAVY